MADTPAPKLPLKSPRSITGAQRRALRALGHHLKVIVHVGQRGVSEQVIAAAAEALEHHELIKISTLRDGPVGHKEAPHLLADAVGAHVAQIVGRTALLYRRHPEDPQVKIPGAIDMGDPS
ncbi:MAG: YhbY family RNA-binding protein [Bradymonadia bacterium]